MKKFLIAVISAISLLLFSGIAASANGVLLEYDGGTHEYTGEFYSLVVKNQLINPPLSPIIFNDRALVPVREIFEEVGAKVSYEGDTQTIKVVGDNTDIKLKINDNVAYVNGKKTKIPDNVVPKLISKVGGETKTMVPVRFISENIGLDVEFDSGDGAILIESDDYKLADENPIVTPYEDTYTAPNQLHVTDVSYAITSTKTARVTVTADNSIDSYEDFVLSDPERLVLDIYGASLRGVIENQSVGAAGIKMIRTGDNGERARIVLDMEGLQTYSVSQTSDNVLEIVTAIKLPEVAPRNTSKNETSYSPHSNDDKLIILDAGHGGSDSGAVGELNGEPLYEKDLTLQITKRVQGILEKAGYNVSLTRTGDTLPSLTERPAQANEENAALFISIHINAVDDHPEASGTEVYYATENNDDGYGITSEQFAENVLTRMLKYMQSVNRGVKSAEHAVTRRCNMPAVLAEVGFITNPEEAYLMSTYEYQQKAAQGIAEGIIITLRNITMPE